MAVGMATKKLTITLDEEQLEAVRRLVAQEKAESVSAFVKHAVDVALADVAGWGAMLGVALRETGGPLTAKERAWADSILKGTVRAKARARKRRAA
jgi:Arc/MetJ-type ribon-helix-helix transcriptional regulator